MVEFVDYKCDSVWHFSEGESTKLQRITIRVGYPLPLNFLIRMILESRLLWCDWPSPELWTSWEDMPQFIHCSFY